MDVKNLQASQLKPLCAEIREFLIENVSKTGGHLSSNLGTVELTVALHRIFTTPQDEFVWDVGHQCYTHKILTGRKARFTTLRQKNGLSGFPSPEESEHDVFIAGHGNTSISAAIGLAQAKRIQGEKGKVIAIVGDGAFTGGMIYEGMNNIRALDNLIVVLNDNEMSISKNVGSVAQYLTSLRTSPHYFKVKRNVQSALDAVPLIGTPVRVGLQNIKATFRRAIYHSTMFEEMGFQYVGPIDGHDVDELATLFSAYQEEQVAPLFVHILTKKGKGFEPAEENPGEFHGVSAFKPENIQDPDISSDQSFSHVFGHKLAKLAEEDERICAVTAAMKYGTGLQFFYKQHKNRFFDVGMAEQHAVTFGAGLAKNGMRPVVAIYSTFLQRAYDQIIHDAYLQNSNLLLAIDRAGLVPADGATHQGVFDVAFLSQLPGIQVVSPCNYAELDYWLEHLLHKDGIRVLRYPRGGQNERLGELGCSKNEFDYIKGSNAAKTAFVTYGSETQVVLETVDALEGSADIYKLCVIHPLPVGLCDALFPYDNIIFAEEGIAAGGIGEHLAAALLQQGYQGNYRHVALPSRGIPHASVEELRSMFGLDVEGLLAVERGLR